MVDGLRLPFDHASLHVEIFLLYKKIAVRNNTGPGIDIDLHPFGMHDIALVLQEDVSLGHGLSGLVVQHDLIRLKPQPLLLDLHVADRNIPVIGPVIIEGVRRYRNRDFLRKHFAPGMSGRSRQNRGDKQQKEYVRGRGSHVNASFLCRTSSRSLREQP
jgi:hypothetical protein